MTVINTNPAAMRALNGSRLAHAELRTATERLSTGKRINSAKGDAAAIECLESLDAGGKAAKYSRKLLALRSG